MGSQEMVFDDRAASAIQAQPWADLLSRSSMLRIMYTPILHTIRQQSVRRGNEVSPGCFSTLMQPKGILPNPHPAARHILISGLLWYESHHYPVGRLTKGH